VNQTEFSPARTVFFRDEDGERLTNQASGQIRAIAADLPWILRTYAGDLRRKVWIHASFWKRERPQMESLVQMMRESSLYERIRLQTGKYHQTRLHRLVNAARVDQGLPVIEQRAFTIWLNRLKKRYQNRSRENVRG
jgi:hypothetical protein